MLTGNLKGSRCVARKEIRTHDGIITAFTEGVVLAEVDNLGRRLLEVRWENGMICYAFPSEVEIINVVSPDNGE